MKVFTLKNKYQTIKILNYGATIYKWHAFSNRQNIVLTNKNKKDYLKNDSSYLGATIGRVANRISNSRFTLNDQLYVLDSNEGNHHHHGGPNGFFKQKFEVLKYHENELVLMYYEKETLTKYPGNLVVIVSYLLNENSLLVTFEATSDKDTIVNLTNHPYFNLSNEENILNHTIKVDSTKTLEVDNELIPTGNITNNEKNLLNLSNEKSLKEILSEKSLVKTNGLDNYFLFNDNQEIVLNYQNKSLKVTTSYPGTQLYSSNWPIKQKLLKRKYQKHLALAIEPAFETDAINNTNFSNIVLKANETYTHYIKYTLSEQ